MSLLLLLRNTGGGGAVIPAPTLYASPIHTHRQPADDEYRQPATHTYRERT